MKEVLIWEGKYKGINARIFRSADWTSLRWVSDKYLPHEVSFQQCTGESLSNGCRERFLYGEWINSKKRFLIYPVIFPDKSGRVMDEIKGFSLFAATLTYSQNSSFPKWRQAGKKLYFVKVEGSEKL